MFDSTFLPSSADWMREMRNGDWEAAWRISDRSCVDRRALRPRDPLAGEWLPRHLQWVWECWGRVAIWKLEQCRSSGASSRKPPGSSGSIS